VVNEHAPMRKASKKEKRLQKILANRWNIEINSL